MPERSRGQLPAGARTIPRTRWSGSGSRWRAGPVTLVVLAGGLWLFGTGEAALVAAREGVSPWTVLAQGLGGRLGVSTGTATLLISVAILGSWRLLGERPGLGTLANAIVIAAAIDVMGAVLPRPSSPVLQVAQILAGIGCVGMGSALYLTANLGPGPRDGLMTGLHRRTGAPVARVRLGLELTVVSLGWVLGGVVGVGTLLFAVLIGYALSLALRAVAPAAPVTPAAPGPAQRAAPAPRAPR